MRCLRTAWLASLVLVAAVSVAPADQAPWLDDAWTVRRVVDVTAEKSGQGGDDVAVCAFYTGGFARPDAGDVRVATGARKVIKHRVLQVGPGDRIRVAFEVVPTISRYYIYYGNPKAPAPPPWDIQRGVLLEARRWSGGDAINKLAQIQAAWAKAEPLGTDFVSHISFGHNPFAAEGTPSVFHYVGWFIPPRPGTYTVATSSNDASWVLIDGLEVVAWPGRHGAVSDARHAKEVPLTQSLHRLDYWHVNLSGSMMAVAAWQVPEDKGFRPIPPDAFLPVAEAKLVEVDLRGERAVADFSAENVGESWWPDRYPVRMQFTNLSKGIDMARGGRADWDFGDGQIGSGPNPTHVYLAPGDYAVTLKASRGTLASTFRTKVHVDRDWWRQAGRDIEPIAQYAKEVAKYDFQKLDVPNLILAVDLFDHQKMRPPLMAAATELALRRSGVKESEALAKGLLLGEKHRAAGQPQEAIQVYAAVEKRLKQPAAQAQVAVQIGETLLNDLHRYDDAEKEYQRVLKTYATAGQDRVIRRAHIGLGDIRRHRGDGAKAREAYATATAIRLEFQPPNVAAVRVGTLARYVEEYTRERAWEWAFPFIDDWAWEFPHDKLKGHWSLLRAQALLAKGDRAAALREALDLLGASPESAYAVRLLMFAAECHVAQGEPDKGRLLLRTAVEDYPEDPLRDDARKRLQALGGPVKTQ
ncbi:MAG TPA: PKD domain-containing protein [Phycisphaerae bacterium]|nr:PKD domain-containing protein [Phycisphaerae bacterium]